MPQVIHIDGPPPGLMRRLAEMQQRINEEYSALTPEQRAKRAKEELAYMPGQAYLLDPEDDPA
jgi:hypothetical protein